MGRTSEVPKVDEFSRTSMRAAYKFGPTPRLGVNQSRRRSLYSTHGYNKDSVPIIAFLSVTWGGLGKREKIVIHSIHKSWIAKYISIYKIQCYIT